MKTIRIGQTLIALAAMILPGQNLQAGGSGLSIAVVINQSSSNSVELANYFCERRQVPPQNVCRINWAGGRVGWTRAQYESTLRTPLLALLAARQLTNQIDFVVLSMDIPYRVNDSNGINSTTSALFYGFKPDDAGALPSCTLPASSFSGYAGSEGIFRNTSPGSNPNTFLVTMLTANSLAQAKHLVDQGVNSDGAFPSQTAFLSKTGDPFRNIRYQNSDNAVFNTRLRGNYSAQRVFEDSFSTRADILGYQTGLEYFSVLTNAFVPGAMADNLTSFGGFLFDPTYQTNILEFIRGGAAGAYGTIVEPCAYLEKFPDPQNYFFQARGFAMAECYYQSLTNPYQGVIVAEPLAAPFRLTAGGSWSGLSSNALLSATTNLSLQLTSGDASHPLQQVDLFVDGLRFQTLTNIAPRQNNVLNVTLNGRSMNFTVPASATIQSVASGVASLLNASSNKAVTQVSAVAHGDRIELQSTNTTRTGAQNSIGVNSSIGSASALTAFIAASRNDFLDTLASGRRSFRVTGAPGIGTSFQVTLTKTNGAQVTLAVTNNTLGATAYQLTAQLLAAINGAASLQSADGLVAEDLLDLEPGSAAQFNLRARSQGFAAAQLQADFGVTLPVVVMPSAAVRLNENIGDLQPRNHLYLTAGQTNLAFSFALNTTNLSDGYHELTAVAYEGSHARTQTRFSRNVRIKNTPLSDTFTLTDADSVTAVEATFHFAVTANTNNVTRIELFSTGGSAGVVSNQATASFAVDGPSFGPGLHPFYAIVTAAGGQSYRTQTIPLRLVGAEAPFLVQVTGQRPFSISWPAIAGRRYDVLNTSNVAGAFQLRDTFQPVTTGPFSWTETNNAQRFYRVRVSP
ncbi:MAG TPA: TIGR03790 family protein [Verrucomicrobiae bacterium]|jgi:uncharacterized protein (TIGR03790 family)